VTVDRNQSGPVLINILNSTSLRVLLVIDIQYMRIIPCLPLPQLYYYYLYSTDENGLCALEI
jgi:hypothetical protein